MAKTFSITRRVLFHETDMAGVMHFSNYFRLMEEVEHAWWRSLGLSVIDSDGGSGNAKSEPVNWPRVSASCEFTAPVRFEDELALNLKVAKLGQKSIAFEVEFAHGDKLVGRGTMRAACCTMKNGKFTAVAIPEALRARIAEAAGLEKTA